MIELIKTNNLVTISFVEALLKGQGIEYLVLDQHMSMLEGSIGAIQRRVMVDADALNRARRILQDAELGNELKAIVGP
ncbi:MAG: DUF2007 domain-containing protein [Rhizobiaceae bacterium]|nr:DUF2007 domain-containing protein [Rhizobiaceae bacterium]MBL4696024.1 DUF2007 domain-containing protein [Rhizobiaceae bacterium]